MDNGGGHRGPGIRVTDLEVNSVRILSEHDFDIAVSMDQRIGDDFGNHDLSIVDQRLELPTEQIVPYKFPRGPHTSDVALLDGHPGDPVG